MSGEGRGAPRGSRWSLYVLVALGGLGWWLGLEPGLNSPVGSSSTRRSTEPTAVFERRPDRPAQERSTAPDDEGRTWSFQLLDSRGRPAAGVLVGVVGRSDGSPILASSDERGAVRVGVPGSIAADEPVAVCVGSLGQVCELELGADSGRVQTVRLPEPVVRRGQLWLPDGTPAGGLELRLRQVGLLGDATGRGSSLLAELIELRRPARAVELAADPLGWFELGGLDPGLYLVEARPAGSGDYERLYLAEQRGSLIELDGADERPLELVIDGLLCELALFDRSFAPVPGARFRLEGRAEDGRRFGRELALAAESEVGELWLPPSRELRVVGERDDLAPTVREVDLWGQPTGVVRVELESPGLPGIALLRPRPIAPDGQDVPFLIEAARVGSGPELPETLPVFEDELEWFGPLAPGSWRLTIAPQGDRHPLAPGFELPFEPLSVRVELRAGEGRSLELPLRPGRRLLLTVHGSLTDLARVTLDGPLGAKEQSFVDPSLGVRRRLPASGRVQLGYEPIPREASRLCLFRVDGGRECHQLPAGEGDLELELQF